MQEVRRLSAPGESIVSLPWNAGLYFLAERRNASRYDLFIPASVLPEDVPEITAALDQARLIVYWTARDSFIKNTSLDDRTPELHAVHYVALPRRRRGQRLPPAAQGVIRGAAPHRRPARRSDARRSMRPLLPPGGGAMRARRRDAVGSSRGGVGSRARASAGGAAEGRARTGPAGPAGPAAGPALRCARSAQMWPGRPSRRGSTRGPRACAASLGWVLT